MRCGRQDTLKGGRIAPAVDPVQERRALRRTLWVVAVVARLPGSVFIALHTLPLARGYGGVLEDVVMCADNDRRGILVDHSFPPSERFSANYAAGISA